MANSPLALGEGLLLTEVQGPNGVRWGGKALALLSLLVGLVLALTLSPLARSYSFDHTEHHLAVQEPPINMALQRMQLPRTQRLSQPAGIRAPARNIMRPPAAIEPDNAVAASSSTPAGKLTDPEATKATKRRFLLAWAGIVAASPFVVGKLGLLQPEEFKGEDSIMKPRAFGTCIAEAQGKLRWGADVKTADQIGCFNRAFAEYAGYWRSTDFLKTESAASGEITFYDTMSGKPLFIAPRGRTFEEFVAESNKHGWPSFRDQEVVAENVRVLGDGETVSADGTHLGHNIPDFSGNRYCINIVSIAGFGDEKK